MTLDQNIISYIAHNFKEGANQDSLSQYIDKMQKEIDFTCQNDRFRTEEASRTLNYAFAEVENDFGQLEEIMKKFDSLKQSDFNQIKKTSEDLVFKVAKDFNKKNLKEFAPGKIDKPKESFEREKNEQVKMGENSKKANCFEQNDSMNFADEDDRVSSNKSHFAKKEPKRRKEEIFEPEIFSKRANKKNTSKKHDVFDDFSDFL